MREEAARSVVSVQASIQTYADMVYRLAYARCKNAADAEDVTQEVEDLFDALRVDRAELTQRVLERAERRKRFMPVRRGLIVALAATLVAGMALAAVSESPLIERLFRRGDANRQAIESVVTAPGAAEKDGVSLRMDEYLIDRDTLHFDWTVTSIREKDVYYTTAYTIAYANETDEATAEDSVGGAYGSASSAECGDAMMTRLTKEQPSRGGWSDYGYLRPLKGPVTVSVTIRAYETNLTPVPVENALDVRYPEEGSTLVSTLAANGQIGVDPSGLCSVASYEAFQKSAETLYAQGIEPDEADERALTESGLMTELCEVTVEVVIQPEAVAPSRFALKEERVFALPGRTVTLRTLDVNAASTILEYVVAPDAAKTEADWATGLWYLIFDQSGNLLNVDCALSMNIRETEAGYAVSVGGDALPETVTALRFVPTCALERGDNEPSNDYYLRMAEAADEADCFIVELNP